MRAATLLLLTLGACAAPAQDPRPGLLCMIDGMAVRVESPMPMVGGPGFHISGAGPVWFVPAASLRDCRA